MNAAVQGMTSWNGSVQSIGLLAALVGAMVLLLCFVVIGVLVFLFRQNNRQTEAYTKSVDRLYNMLDHHTQVYCEQNEGWRATVREISETTKKASETYCSKLELLAAGLHDICRAPGTRSRAGDVTA